MRNMPAATKNLLIINTLAYVATIVFPSLTTWGGLHFVLSPWFHFWQPFTYMFIHGGLMHLFFNMFSLWMFGCVMESVWGARRFTTYYIICGLGAALIQEIAQWVGMAYFGVMPGITVGASGAIYAILLAYGMTFPNERLFIFPLPIPIKAKWFIAIYIAIELFSVAGSYGDGIAHIAHLGGMLFGFFLIRHWRAQPFISFVPPKRKPRQQKQAKIKIEPGSVQAMHETDEQYNERRRSRQAEVDIILDKIRKSGYDSLTKDEKKRLFDYSKDI